MTIPLEAVQILDQVLADLDRAGSGLGRLRELLACGRDGTAGDLCQASPQPWPGDLIDVGAAAQRARRAKDTVRSWARNHPAGTPGGFGVKIGARWWISASPFHDFLKRGGT